MEIGLVDCSEPSDVWVVLTDVDDYDSEENAITTTMVLFATASERTAREYCVHHSGCVCKRVEMR